MCLHRICTEISNTHFVIRCTNHPQGISNSEVGSSGRAACSTNGNRHFLCGCVDDGSMDFSQSLERSLLFVLRGKNVCRSSREEIPLREANRKTKARDNESTWCTEAMTRTVFGESTQPRSHVRLAPPNPATQVFRIRPTIPRDKLVVAETRCKEFDKKTGDVI